MFLAKSPAPCIGKCCTNTDMFLAKHVYCISLKNVGGRLSDRKMSRAGNL